MFNQRNSDYLLLVLTGIATQNIGKKTIHFILYLILI